MPKAYSKFEVDDAKTLIKPSQQHFILLQNYQTNYPFLYFLFFHSHYFLQFYAPWKCAHERHTYEGCEHKECKF